MATDLTLKVVCILVALGSIHSEVCPDEWFMWMNTCYYLSAAKDTRSNANNSCHEMDSHLAHIESDDENTFLTELLKRRKKRNRQIERSEPTKHRSGLSAQNNRVVSEYDSKATYVNEIPCVALATAERPNKASYVNGFDVNALTNEYEQFEHLTAEKKSANQNGPTSNDIGAYATINDIETSFPDVIPQKTPVVKATPKPSVGSIAREYGSVEQQYAVVDKSKKKKKQTDEKIEQMYAKPMKKSKNDFSSDEE
ncbi:hypothetical protein CAPTEDRAFT_204625 [Capitella teleta]|uniref:C-type lectin domain-containing protein n=1 Tax=Capitella teleta TaxID=283909 RepID=R7ULD1_CAPTE|nr:hypothetical protein CAPTEDRAFT_204625 [Capitella teleta]|eukprot:ELU07020.1 hypothetical protein CAPTEDRAFT_204625 [Capitella teleta]